MQLWFLGPCDPFSQSLKRDIARSLVLTLRLNGLCDVTRESPHVAAAGGILGYITTLCDPDVLEVNCGSSGSRSYGGVIRGKRSSQPQDEDEPTSLVNIEVTLQDNAR